MKNFLKWGAIVVGCLVVVIIAALLIIPMFVDVQKYKPVIEDKVVEATGRPFSLPAVLPRTNFRMRSMSARSGSICRSLFRCHSSASLVRVVPNWGI